MTRYWALVDNATGNLCHEGMGTGGVPFLVRIEDDKNKVPEIPPMSPRGTERVHVEIRIVKWPDRKRAHKSSDSRASKQ